MPETEFLPSQDHPEISHRGHRERLRQRFLNNGGESFPDYELLELLLCLAIPLKDMKPLAKILLDRFDNFAGVITADRHELTKIPGVKENIATILAIVTSAAKRMAEKKILQKPIISNWQSLVDYCRITLAYESIERFLILFLDRKNVLIRAEFQESGTVDQAPVYPREVAKRALELNASALIMVHNHPSGDPKPSQSDIAITKLVYKALSTIDISLHDHLIIGKFDTFSLRSMNIPDLFSSSQEM
jgi:DNA repair protein RadC